MRVVDREQAKAVGGFRSTTRANTRLLALYRAGFLRRFFIGTVAGGKKSLYALSRRGAQTAEVPYRGIRRPQDQILLADNQVHHLLHTNIIYIEVKHRPLPDCAQLIRWVALHHPLDTSTNLIPDGYFEVILNGKTISMFLEVDLGTEWSRIWKQKIQNYLRYAFSGRHQDLFGQQRFRVLVVTNSDRRLAAIRKVAATQTSKIFWFSTFESINHGGFWSTCWLRPIGDELLPLL